MAWFEVLESVQGDGGFRYDFRSGEVFHSVAGLVSSSADDGCARSEFQAGLELGEVLFGQWAY